MLLVCAVNEAMPLPRPCWMVGAALQPEDVPACTELLWEAVPDCAAQAHSRQEKQYCCLSGDSP